MLLILIIIFIRLLESLKNFPHFPFDSYHWSIKRSYHLIFRQIWTKFLVTNTLKACDTVMVVSKFFWFFLSQKNLELDKKRDEKKAQKRHFRAYGKILPMASGNCPGGNFFTT